MAFASHPTDGLNDAQFLAAVQAATISGPQFRHVDHLRVAWICLQAEDFANGAARFCRLFRSYIRSIGAEAKYHETITWFFLVVMNQRVRTGIEPESWEQFAARNPDLITRGAAILYANYDAATLAKPEARRIFIFPTISSIGPDSAPAVAPMPGAAAATRAG